MASTNARKGDTQRPHQLHTSRSFTRIEPTSPSSPARTRASTIQNGDTAALKSPTIVMASEKGKPRSKSKMFDTSLESDEEKQDTSDDEVGKLSATAEILPIELISLTDSFMESLSAKVHPSPPTIDRLSMLFQEFYILADNHINTHISAISSRQHRESSPAPSVSSKPSTANKIRTKASSISGKDRPKIAAERIGSEQQLLTADEIAERKKGRKILEQQRVALEEAVERRLCEGMYDRIWRHRSTQDEAQDEMLRSKIAALALVGIGPTDLSIDLGDEATEDMEKDVRQWLEGAREELLAMNKERYPVGKLQHLKAAHKAIVDTLAHFHPSSSADEIMPMMIYTLITSPPEETSVMSDLYFIQRFRSESKIDGEAAYCLTNLEAAITFLMTVDLASLRADEFLSGPPKADSGRSTPKGEQQRGPNLGITSPPRLSAASLSSTTANSADSEFKTPLKPESAVNSLRPALQLHNRRLSDLLQTPAHAVGAAGDAVFNTADQGFKTIGDSLGSSYKFLIGKLKERQESVSGGNAEIVVPKTLDDARKLVGAPPDDDGSASGGSSLHTPDHKDANFKDEKVLSMIIGRKPARDHSADSLQSSGSGKKVAFVEEGKEKEKVQSPLSATSITSGNPAIVESMRNLGNSFNPMTRIAGLSVMRGFGRPAATPPIATAKDVADGGVADLTTAFPDLVPALPPKQQTKVAPPIKRFMEIQTPGELQLKEVLELLRDYRRLATALKDLDAF